MSEDTTEYSKQPCEELHRIGDQELYTPDYQLVCAWAQQCELEPEEVLRRLLKPTSDNGITTEIVAGKFKSIAIEYETVLPITKLPDTGELIIEKLSLIGGKLTTLDLSQMPKLTELLCSHSITELDLSPVPNLTILACFGNQLTELDLSPVPNLTKLACHANALTELALSHVPELTVLACMENQLTELDLSQVPKLTILGCAHNQIKELDLSQVPNLTKLHAMYNQLTELDLSHVPGLAVLECLRNQLTNLDITPLHSLKSLKHDKDKTKLIHRPDQNF